MAETITNIATNAEENIIPTDISEHMQKAYLNYAMSVIVSRALPDVRDGLKPVQRRIFYAMQDQNMTFSGRFTKCASVIGEVMKKYHPHGDSSIYDALVRMGQDFSLRYPLITPQGNFGSIDGDPPAAYRYTECKMAKITEELYADIDKETVSFELNDLQQMEPVVLPSILPNLLLNGSEGIAVGMATKIPPHNLVEIVDGINELIRQQEKTEIKVEDVEVDVIDTKQKLKIARNEFASNASVEDLCEFIQGPDFPTGGIIYDKKELIQMYATGRGRVVTRAKLTIEEDKKGKTRILVSELPYQVNKATLISKIADLVKEKKLEEITDIRDESSRKEIRIVIELRKGVIPKKVENRLYKFTQLQTTFNANMVALVNNEPKLLTLKAILEEYVKHRQEIIINRSIFLWKKAKHREHILQGLKKALDIIDEIIELIKKSKDADAAKIGLISKFGFSEIQAQAILDMQLRRLAALERQKIEDELKEVIKELKGYEEIMSNPAKVIEVIQNELNSLKEKYGDERRTKVIKGKIGEISDEDLVANKPSIITISQEGYVKRMEEDAYKKQGRGGMGVSGTDLKDEDVISVVKVCNTHDFAFFFTNSGKVYKMRVWEVPEYQRKAKGTPLVNFLNMKSEEKIEAFFTLAPQELENGKGFVFFVTRKGTVKKTPLDQYENIRSSGILAINLDKDDSLVFVDVTNGNNDLIITTACGQSIRFPENEVRAMGRSAGGVGGIKLKDKADYVVGAEIIEQGDSTSQLLVVSQLGYGKKTPLAEYSPQKRAGSGILTYKVTDKTGNLVCAKKIEKDKETDLLLATQTGMMIRLDSAQVPTLGRNTQGVRLIKIKEGDKVTSVAAIAESEEAEE